MKIHHIGYVVKNIEKDMKAFIDLGYEKTGDLIIDESRDIKILFVKNESCLIELIEPMSQKAPVYSILKKNGNCPYHICYITDDLAKEINILKTQGYFCIINPAKAIAFDNNLVAFLYKAEVGIIELVEFK